MLANLQPACVMHHWNGGNFTTVINVYFFLNHMNTTTYLSAHKHQNNQQPVVT